MSNAFTADIEKDATHLICCMCYKRIEHKGNWTQGDNAEPLIVLEKSDPSIVNHNRCCAPCNDIVIQVRMLHAFGQVGVAQLMAGMFHRAKTASDVIVAHMQTIEAFQYLGDTHEAQFVAVAQRGEEE